jgi:hypothetical protein
LSKHPSKFQGYPKGTTWFRYQFWQSDKRSFLQFLIWL